MHWTDHNEAEHWISTVLHAQFFQLLSCIFAHSEEWKSMIAQKIPSHNVLAITSNGVQDRYAGYFKSITCTFSADSDSTREHSVSFCEHNPTTMPEIHAEVEGKGPIKLIDVSPHGDFVSLIVSTIDDQNHSRC